MIVIKYGKTLFQHFKLDHGTVLAHLRRSPTDPTFNVFFPSVKIIELFSCSFWEHGSLKQGTYGITLGGGEDEYKSEISWELFELSY